MKTVKSGSRGTDVELCQLALTRAEYNIKIDGIFGAETEKTVILFQKRNKLIEDGIVGTKTWNALTPYLKGYISHKIVNGDTIYRLARRYNTTVTAIETANPDLKPLNLTIGEIITVPFAFSVVSKEIRMTSVALGFAAEGLAARYPFLNIGEAGKSVMGKPIYFISVGEGENEVFYNGTHHANEWITSTLLMLFIEKYSKAFSRGDRIGGYSSRELFRTTTLYVIPSVNPDGADLVTGALSAGSYYNSAISISDDYPAIPFPLGWKANINGTDPNLQYPAGWENAREIKFGQGYISPAPRDYVGEAPLCAPESKAVFDFTKNHDFSLTVSYHTQGGVIYWKYLDIEPPKSREIAELFGKFSGYYVEDVPFDSGFAGYKDWFISEYNRPGFTIEVGYGTSPVPLSQIDDIYSRNERILCSALLVK